MSSNQRLVGNVSSSAGPKRIYEPSGMIPKYTVNMEK